MLGKEKITLLTGACTGIPHEVAKAAYQIGGEVIGYSPAINSYEHVENFNFPLDSYSKIIFHDRKSTKNDAFILRSKQMIDESSFVINIFGNWGTLNELIFSVFSGKTIFNCQFTGGISELFPSIYSNLNSESQYNYNSTLININNFSELRENIKARINKNNLVYENVLVDN